MGFVSVPFQGCPRFTHGEVLVSARFLSLPPWRASLCRGRQLCGLGGIGAVALCARQPLHLKWAASLTAPTATHKGWGVLLVA